MGLTSGGAFFFGGRGNDISMIIDNWEGNEVCVEECIENSDRERHMLLGEGDRE